jgi:hypothetical protein
MRAAECPLHKIKKEGDGLSMKLYLHGFTNNVFPFLEVGGILSNWGWDRKLD